MQNSGGGYKQQIEPRYHTKKIILKFDDPLAKILRTHFSMSIGACEYICGRAEASLYRESKFPSRVIGTFGRLVFVPEEYLSRIHLITIRSTHI